MHRVELKGTSKAVYNDPEGVPNAPCGVERSYVHSRTCWVRSFLMHRVELKGLGMLVVFVLLMLVPNAPCGVESGLSKFSFKFVIKITVPNAPCGVESVGFCCLCALPCLACS